RRAGHPRRAARARRPVLRDVYEAARRRVQPVPRSGGGRQARRGRGAGVDTRRGARRRAGPGPHPRRGVEAPANKFEPSRLGARLRGRQTGGRGMRKAWLAGVGLLLLPALPARGEEWARQYALKGRPEVHVTTDDGSVRIEASDRPEVSARVTTRGWRIGADEVTITESQTGDRVDIEVRVPQNHWGMNFSH